MTRSASLLAAVLCLTPIAMPAFAHHSGAMYDNEKQLIVEGTIKEFAWTNPHVLVKVMENPKDGQPAKEWLLETTSPGNLRRLGWTKDTFKPGDRVKVTVLPMRSGEPGGALVRATMTDTGKEFHVTIGQGDKQGEEFDVQKLHKD